MEKMVIASSFWRGKKVFLTGHTGFKGGWLTLWLNRLGAKVSGFSLEPDSDLSLFNQACVHDALDKHYIGDIRDAGQLEQAMQHTEPEIVIHMAAQPLVRESYFDPVKTYATNVLGTVHLFEAVRKAPSVKAVLNITTDKCYENKEWIWGYRENESLGGYDPYSSSKACAELVSSAYLRSFFQDSGVGLATARAGNVIGGGDWAKDRIIPDAIRSFLANQPLFVRNPDSIRPWQFVLEPLGGYLILCEQLIRQPSLYSDAWNFGPDPSDAQPVSYLVETMVTQWGWGGHARWTSDQAKGNLHEAQYLKLDCSKANTLLGWKPVWNLKRALKETTDWFKACADNQDMHSFTMKQIETYQQELNHVPSL